MEVKFLNNFVINHTIISFVLYKFWGVKLFLITFDTNKLLVYSTWLCTCI